MTARWLLALLLVVLPTVAGAQIVDKTQNSAPFGLNAAAASWAACVYPPSVAASCVKLDYQGYQGVAALLKGTWAGTVVGGISADGGTTVTDVNLISSAGVSAASVTAAGLYNPSTVSGAQMFLVRVSVYTSGSVDVVLRGTSAQARGTPIGGGPPAPSNATYLTATAESGLSAEVNLGALTAGVLYHTVSAGTSTPAVIACTAGVLMGGAPPTCTLTPAGLTSVGIGTTSPATEFTVASALTTSPRGIMSAQYNTGTDGARLHMRKGRGTEGTPLVVVTGDNLGRIVASGYDGAAYLEMAGIIFAAEGTIATNRVPTSITFQTATNAAPSVLTSWLTLNSAGKFFPIINNSIDLGDPTHAWGTIYVSGVVACSACTSLDLGAASASSWRITSAKILTNHMPVLFAALATPSVGSMVYCSDCTAPIGGIMATCTGSGTGAWAFRVNTTPAWGCIGI